jgi:hypothetical protein
VACADALGSFSSPTASAAVVAGTASALPTSAIIVEKNQGFELQ